MKKLFAEIILNKDELKESNCNRIELEYYKISRKERKISKANVYGIEVVKREYKKDKKLKEKSRIKDLTNDEKNVNRLLQLLKRNKVTPMSLKEVIEEEL